MTRGKSKWRHSQARDTVQGDSLLRLRTIFLARQVQDGAQNRFMGTVIKTP